MLLHGLRSHDISILLPYKESVLWYGGVAKIVVTNEMYILEHL